jgi:hypothetical protein
VKRTAAAPKLDSHLGTESVRQTVLEFDDFGRSDLSHSRASTSGGFLTAAKPNGLFDLADAPAFVNRPLSDMLGKRSVINGRKGPSVTSRQLPSLNHSLDGGRQSEESQRVAYRRPTLPNPPTNLVVGHAKIFQELLVGGGFLEGREV